MRFLAADAARVLHIANCQEAEVGLLRRLLEGVGTAGKERVGRATLQADVGKALWQLTFRQLTLSVFEALAVPKRGMGTFERPSSCSATRREWVAGRSYAVIFDTLAEAKFGSGVIMSPSKMLWRYARAASATM